MKRRVALTLLLLLTGIHAMAVEEASYRTELSDGAYSIRSYPPRIVAETQVRGDMDQASSRGFRRLAGYIFGGNRAASGQAEKIAMTAPVIVVPETAPVIVEPETAPVIVEPETATAWRVQFVMPARYSLAELPQPLDPQVELRTLPATRYAVIAFSGLCWQSTVQARASALQDWVVAHQLHAHGPLRLARYDPPWTLPFLRRNEILLELAP